MGAAAALALVAVSPATALADGGEDDIVTVAAGLDGPRQLSEFKGHQLVVAEADSGEVSSVDLRDGRVRTLLSGLGNAQGVDYKYGGLFVAVGEAPPAEEGAPPVPPGTPSQVVVEAKPDGQILRTWDLLQYELDHNPDGQQQFMEVDGEQVPIETLSNPFAVLAQPNRLLVSDAGANAVLSIDLRSGKISTFFVPPTVTDTPECAEAENNPGTVGCDSVPTEIAEGPNGLIYVGTLGAEAPGAARVYVLDRHGEVVDVIGGLTGVTGVAVDPHGTVYASNVLEGFPEGPPAEDFDPSTIGEVTRISPSGERATAQVTMPTGLEWTHGHLYASAWSVAGFLGMPGAGEVQRTGSGAFTGLQP
ncbi:ScyD/ScyE family protein [Blastococcus sp. SYSU DS0753]